VLLAHRQSVRCALVPSLQGLPMLEAAWGGLPLLALWAALVMWNNRHG
jgi:hypothetical protein